MGNKSYRLKAYCKSQAELRLKHQTIVAKLASDIILWNRMCESFLSGKIFDEIKEYPRNWINNTLDGYGSYLCREVRYCYKQKHIRINLKNVKCSCCGDLFNFSIYAILTNTPIIDHLDKYQWSVDNEHSQSHKKELKGRVLLCNGCRPIFKRVMSEFKLRTRNVPMLLTRTLQIKIKKYENNNQKC